MKRVDRNGIVLVALLAMGCAKFTAVDNLDAGDGGGQITVSPWPGQFSIAASTEQRVVQGATTKIPVSITRVGAPFTDIQISLKDAPSGIATSPLTIPVGESTGMLEVTVADSVAQGPVPNVKFAGRTVDGQASATAALPLFVRGPSGSLDTTFANGGRLVGFCGQIDMPPSEVLISDDDHIFVVGNCRTAVGASMTTSVARLTADGAFDGYGGRGIISLSVNQQTALLLADGSVIVGGMHTGSMSEATYEKLATDGSLVAAPLLMNIPIGRAGSFVRSMALGPDGGIFMALDVQVPDSMGPYVMGIAKITSDGAPDTNFGSSGFASTNFEGTADSSFGKAIAVRSNGKIVIAGSWTRNDPASTGYGILQLQNAALDQSFGAGGQVVFEDPNINNLLGLVLLPDDRVIVPLQDCFTAPSTYCSYSLNAFDSQGNVDTTFGNGGQVYLSSFGGLFLDNQNRLLVTTSTAGALESISRLTDDGKPDTSFGTNGKGTVTLPLPANSPPSGGSVAAGVQKDGRIVVLSMESITGGDILVVSRIWD
ncbi:MAG: hypothetical protein FWD69_03850 [Polyangiaceae bacterium]|nr:hypothetical protein [Polyangiaceae bacterium]